MCNQKSNMRSQEEAPKTMFFHGVDGAQPTNGSPKTSVPTRNNDLCDEIKIIAPLPASFGKNSGMSGRVFIK